MSRIALICSFCSLHGLRNPAIIALNGNDNAVCNRPHVRAGNRNCRPLCMTKVVDVNFSDDVPTADRLYLEPLVCADSENLLGTAPGEESAELSVFLCSDEHIASLNQEWRGVDGPTDVLSFPQGHDEVGL